MIRSSRWCGQRGVILPKCRAPLRQRLDELMGAGELGISARALLLLEDLRDEWASLDRRVKAYDDELATLTREDDQARRLATILGIGVINATALLAAVGDGSAFSKRRDLAARLGLTPRQHSTGGRTKLLGISKRGNKYIRTQLIHGARAAMAHFAKKPTATGDGCAGCSPERIPTSWWWRSPPSWRESPGRCCATGEALIIRPLPEPDPEPRPAQRRGRSRGLWR